MGQSPSSSGYTPIQESKNEKMKEDNGKSDWKQYHQKFSTNTKSIPEKNGYKKFN